MESNLPNYLPIIEFLEKLRNYFKDTNVNVYIPETVEPIKAENYEYYFPYVVYRSLLEDTGSVYPLDSEKKKMIIDILIDKQDIHTFDSDNEEINELYEYKDKLGKKSRQKRFKKSREKRIKKSKK